LQPSLGDNVQRWSEKADKEYEHDCPNDGYRQPASDGSID